jgi:predicted Zn-ribbon and HTH transcriptional regulator
VTDRTTRQRLADQLRREPATAGQLAAALDLPESTIYDHLDHVAASVGGDDDEQFLVAPPTCRDCGFDRFDDPVNDPSQCPDCRSRNLAPARFQIG